MNKPVTALQDTTRFRNLGASIQVVLALVKLWTDESRKCLPNMGQTSTRLLKEGGPAWKKGILVPFHEQFPEAFKKQDRGCRPVGSPLFQPLLTWSPPHRPLAAAAEAHFAEHPEDVPFAQGAPVFAGAGAAFGGRHPVAVGLPRLPLLPDQGAGYRRSHSCSARAPGPWLH